MTTTLQYTLKEGRAVLVVTALTAAVGQDGDIADETTGTGTTKGNRWIKVGTVWQQMTGPGGNVANGSVAIKNSAGTTLRTISAVNGVITLAATDTIIGTGASIPLNTSAGVLSSGSATRNSPAIITVAAGVATVATASA